MIRRNTRNVSRNVRSNERRSVITRRGSRRLDNEAQMARRTRRFRRYEEDEKEAGDEVENLIDTAEISAIVDKAVDALTGYDCPEKEYDDEEKEELPENEAICVDADEQEIPVSVDEENAKLVIELGDDATVEVDLDQPEEDVDAELAESLEEYFNPEDEEGDDAEDDKEGDAKERRIRRSMNRRLENFKRRQALRRREEAVKRFRRAQALKRIRDERNNEREETRRPAGRVIGRSVEGREETRRPRIGNLRRPGTRGRR